MNNNNNKYEIPSVAPTPFSDPFMFEVADQIILEKDRTIALLKEELVELKEFMSEQRRQKIARDTFTRALASVVEDIVGLFPSFKNMSIDSPEYRSIYATVKGYDHVQIIVDYVDKFKSSLTILRALQTELLQVKIENVTYKPLPGSTPHIMCKTKTSIVGLERAVMGGGLPDNPFSMLKHRIEYILIELIKFGKGVCPNDVCYAHKEAKDEINYYSNEEHSQIWEHKKAFSRRIINATIAYVESLIQNHF
jgi:hypothetical protein